MRIAFVGKGGSGKTTIAALFARYLAARGKPVIAIDADINQHLARTIGISRQSISHLKTLGDYIPHIKEYIRGSNPRIPHTSLMVKTTPPGAGSRLLRIHTPNPIFDACALTHQGITFMATGHFTDDDLGVSCYHAKTGAVELLLNHFIDAENEYVVVDMTAGADAFASGLFTAFDLTAVIVEPTWKSISVLEQYRAYSASYNTPLIIIGNKITSEADKTFIAENINETPLYIGYSSYVSAIEQEKHPPLSALEPENIHSLELLKKQLDSRTKDWNAYLSHIHFFHKKNANGWANALHGTDLTSQIDPLFSFPR